MLLRLMIGITGEERGNVRVKDLIELVIACNRHGNLALKSYTYRLQSLIDPYLGSRNRCDFRVITMLYVLVANTCRTIFYVADYLPHKYENPSLHLTTRGSSSCTISLIVYCCLNLNFQTFHEVIK